MSCPNYKIVFNDETNYVAQDISEEPVVRVIPAKGEQGETGPKGEDGKNFEPTIVSKLPTTGDESKLYLTPKAHTTQTATGNPITATVTDGAGQIEDFQLDGDTFQQTYTGKNLFNPAVYANVIGFNASRTLGDDGSITWVNTTSDSYFPWLYSDSMFGNTVIRSATIPVQPSTQYTVSLKKTTATAIGLYVYEGNSDYVGIKNTYITLRGEIASYTFTTSETTRYVILRFAKWASQETDVLSEIQLEAGSTATSYEPFVGGQASPNPDYPQPIQTVTGEQTITINGTNYPLDLGDIQLCGLGDDGNGNPLYKDRIYRDGEDWKVHKAVAKHALKPNEGWLIPNPASYPNLFQTNAISDLGNLSDAYTTASTSPQAYCEALVYLPGSGDVRATQGFSLFHTVEGGAEYNIARINIAGFTTTTQLKNWLSTCNANFWYGVKIPTDTTITDTTLIAQLEAIRTASLETGTNTITNTATGTNLAGDMEVDYFGYDPTNRYDKFIWLDLNNNYEQIGK